MAATKTYVRFFTIADYLEEEAWLRAQHNAGWRFVKVIPPMFYVFEACEPEDVIYRLDFKNKDASGEYIAMAGDYGWEYAGKCVGWLYFRKKAADADSENDGELFSDNGSRLEMIRHIFRTRMVPLGILFLCCVIPNLRNALRGFPGPGFTVFWSIMFVLYVYLLVHCTKKLNRIKADLE